MLSNFESNAVYYIRKSFSKENVYYYMKNENGFNVRLDLFEYSLHFE